MALTIANWTLSVRLHHNETDLTTDPATRLRHRAEIDREVARHRERAYAQWLLQGGSLHR